MHSPHKLVEAVKSPRANSECSFEKEYASTAHNMYFYFNPV